MATATNLEAEARLLLIEDNPVNMRLAVAILEAAGFQVAQAADAEEALVLLEHRVPDLILTDIGLPGMDGLALTKRLKENGRLRHIPVVALTAFAMNGDEQRALAAGCTGYITKPIQTHGLVEQIRKFLRQRDQA